jgi:hypothetical protein
VRKATTDQQRLTLWRRQSDSRRSHSNQTVAFHTNNSTSLCQIVVDTTTTTSLSCCCRWTTATTAVVVNSGGCESVDGATSGASGVARRIRQWIVITRRRQSILREHIGCGAVWQRFRERCGTLLLLLLLLLVVY